LFKPQAPKPYARIPFPDSYRIGDTYSMLVYDIKPDEFEYAFSFDGPYEPAKGLLFNEENVLLDPYSRAVTGQRKWGEKPEGGKDFEYRARVVKSSFDWGNIKQLEQPFEDLVIYEIHVRGYTKDKSSGVSAPGTFAGLKDKIPYLKDLGINAVELMPIFEFDEMESARVVDGVQLYNYWGYNTVSFFAPNTSYAFNEEHNHEGDELKSLIKALKENGIEVILDVVFNHTAEGNEMGPCFSFKGIDNNVYYMLTPDAHYYNFSGCGNVMNCNHPVVRNFIIDCLRHWAIEYRVDGFRFDLASILGRDQNGAPMANPPILESLAFDPVLGKMKLIAEAWDAGGLYQVGSFPSWNRWAEWNGRYRDDMRSFLKGDDGMAGNAITRITGSRDLYSPESRGHKASVNFLTCHDGFTLYDLYSYNEKHNEKNGWNNTDGDNNGHSWNCGAEGETDDPNVNGLRRRLIKNAFAALLCSRGPAMFFAGDEFCNTQFGNNNAYCQDNIISWLDWGRLEEFKEIHDFVRHMIQFRKEHPILRKMTKPSSCQFPEISVHNGTPFNASTDYKTKLIGIMYAGRNEEDTEDDIVFYCMNAYWEPLVMQLPVLPNGKHWHVDTNTNAEYFDGEDFTEKTELLGVNTIRVPARTTIILVAE
jgi:glycogen debranching enzyme glgX